MNTPHAISALLTISLALSGCNMAERLSNVGDPPELSQIQNPELVDNYHPVSMPMPAPEGRHNSINSLWQRGSRAFFKDQRAFRVGDVLTVKIDYTDTAKIDDKFNPQRNLTSQSALTNFMGYEKYLPKVFPSTVNKNDLTNIGPTNTTIDAKGKKERKDTLKLELAATIIQILPNGNMVIQGHQDVRIAGELKTVELKGIIRREDITSDNCITYDKVAEARISSVTKGEISDLNSTPWGQEVLNKVLPF
jgi:flagellar L-ring protein FlgH